jgi:serine/threonine protein kinase
VPHPLLDTRQIDQPPATFLHAAGTVFAEFGASTQDSGNVSYGIALDSGDRFFVKTAGHADDPLPVLGHADRVALLRNAVTLNRSCAHPTLPPLRNVIESPQGPLLVYDWVAGELLNVSRTRRDDPASAYQRFRHLPAPTIERCLDNVFGLHAGLAAVGWIAVDFYDGCLIYEFNADQLHVVDLDMYRQGPFTNDMGRMFGSSRFMAPEEFEFGAVIDQRSNVYTMGRTALLFLSDGTLSPASFRGSGPRYEVARRACASDPADRFEGMASFYTAWLSAAT